MARRCVAGGVRYGSQAVAADLLPGAASGDCARAAGLVQGPECRGGGYLVRFHRGRRGHARGRARLAGGSVTFTNNSGSTQRLVSLQGPHAFDTGDIAPGSSSAVVFVVTGQYSYQSTTNASIVGVVLVEKDGVDFGRLEVEKVVVRGANDSSPFGFEICVQGPSYPTGNEPGACQLVAATGGVVGWDDVLAGEYTVSETDPGPTWVVSQDTATVQVDRRATSRATITNTAALIAATKSVDWGGAPARSVRFTVCVTGPSYPTTSAADACQEIKDGETAMWRVVPGDYVISEVANPAFASTITPERVSLAAGETAESAVANRMLMLIAPGPPDTGSGLAAASGSSAESAAVLCLTLAALGLAYGRSRRA